MCSNEIDEDIGNRDRSSSCGGLGWPVGEVAGDFGGGAFYVECFAEEVKVVDVECSEFSGSESGERTHVDQGAVSRVDGVGEAVDFVDSEVAVFGLLKAGEWGVVGGVGGDESVANRSL